MTLVDEAQRTVSVWRRIAVGVVAVLLVGVLVIGYLGVGWNRMASVCSTDAAVPAGANGGSWSNSWSWMPPGFTCTWGDTSVTKLWW